MSVDSLYSSESFGILSTAEWQLARRIAASSGLSRSYLLQKFLLHICDLTLQGRASEITEQRIGTQIFNRPANYNPGEDNIVRSYARTLRRRLEDYFQGEGSHEAMRIVIPRGGYVPVFETVPSSASPMEEHQLDPSDFKPLLSEDKPKPALLPTTSVVTLPVSEPRPRRYPAWLLLILGSFLGAALTAALLFKIVSIGSINKEQSAAHPLWNQIFQSTRNTIIVPADSGLGILENLTGHQVTVQEYANGSYLSDLHSPPGLDAGNFNDLRRQCYTSVADLEITNRLSRLPEYNPSRTVLRYAHSVTAEDLKDSNIILLGSKHTNPWDELYEKRLNFRFEYAPTVDDSWIVNAHPLPGEQPRYRNGAGDSTYGTISYLPGPDNNGHILIIQGLNMAATQAAAEVLFNAELIGPILHQATLPNGTLRPFELLIETTSVGATAPEAQIIASRFYSL